MNVSEIKEKMKQGDMDTASKALGISISNASHALKRVGSKYHEAVKSKLEEIIALREILIEQTIQDNSENFHN